MQADDDDRTVITCRHPGRVVIDASDTMLDPRRGFIVRDVLRQLHSYMRGETRLFEQVCATPFIDMLDLSPKQQNEWRIAHREGRWLPLPAVPDWHKLDPFDWDGKWHAAYYQVKRRNMYAFKCITWSEMFQDCVIVVLTSPSFEWWTNLRIEYKKPAIFLMIGNQFSDCCWRVELLYNRWRGPRCEEGCSRRFNVSAEPEVKGHLTRLLAQGFDESRSRSVVDECFTLVCLMLPEFASPTIELCC